MSVIILLCQECRVTVLYDVNNCNVRKRNVGSKLLVITTREVSAFEVCRHGNYVLASILHLLLLLLLARFPDR